MRHPEAGLDHAECTDCQEQSLFHSKEGKGRGEAICARPALVGNKKTVQLVTALSGGDFFPWTFLSSEVRLPISPAVCTHCIQRNIGYSLSPTLCCFSSEPLAPQRLTEHKLHVMAWKGREQAGGEDTFCSLTEATSYCGMAPAALAGGFHALLPGLLQGLLISPCGCLTFVTW